ncbi:hypothetical protein [Undibacterium sp. TJN19]|uniref:hypothetical protein n=1 Tax=Undibacterium sp. TJN19 TaxID=3413055 RepID=UPI003BF3220F
MQLIYVFLSFMFLLADFLPIGTYLMRLIPGFHSMPPGVYAVLTLLFRYAPAALITAWFFKTEKLQQRVPAPIPGVKFLFAGVMITLAVIAISMLASTIEGGGGSYVVSTFAFYILLPARLLMLVGAVKFLMGIPNGVAPDTRD